MGRMMPAASAFADSAPCRCAACGGPLPEVPLDALKLAVAPRMRRVLDVVARRPGISIQQIADFVYAEDPNGGPDEAANSLRVAIFIGNKRIAPMGWRVRTRLGSGSRGYRLERVP